MMMTSTSVGMNQNRRCCGFSCRDQRKVSFVFKTGLLRQQLRCWLECWLEFAGGFCLSSNLGNRILFEKKQQVDCKFLLSKLTVQRLSWSCKFCLWNLFQHRWLLLYKLNGLLTFCYIDSSHERAQIDRKMRREQKRVSNQRSVVSNFRRWSTYEEGYIVFERVVL